MLLEVILYLYILFAGLTGLYLIGSKRHKFGFGELFQCVVLMLIWPVTLLCALFRVGGR